MARVARIVAPGQAHHITQRGNRRQQTFFCDDDYREYLSLLVEWCGRCGVRIWSYCLMPNHVHLIVVPSSADGLCRGIGEAHRRYTRRVNFREGWRGHLWQGRFASFVLDDPHLVTATRYVERNPLRARLVHRAEDWPWSSAAAHVLGGRDAVAEGQWLAELTAGWVCTWGEFLQTTEDEKFQAAMRRHEATGRPMGDKTFIAGLESRLGRPLLPKPPGRPRKREKSEGK
jgi:putative transposase